MSVVALLVVHDNVELPPAGMDCGVATKLPIAEAVTVVTVTVTCAVTEAVLLLAVNV